MTAAARVYWILIWHRSARAFRIDAMQLLRGGPAWASRTPKSMLADWDVGRLRRAERCAELSRVAYIRACAGLKQLGEVDPTAAEVAALILLRLEVNHDVDLTLQVFAGRIPVLVRSRHGIGRRGEA